MKILVVLPRFPYPLEKGDKLRAYHLIRTLAARHEVYLFALTHHSVPSDALQQMRQFCKEIRVYRLSRFMGAFRVLRCFLGVKSLQMGYWFSPKARKQYRQFEAEVQPDVLFSQMVRTMKYVSWSTYPKVMDFQDALSMNVERRMKERRGLSYFALHYEFKMLRSAEYNAFKIFDELTIISEPDSEAIPQHKDSQIHILPNGVDFDYFQPMQVEKQFDLVFCGNMQYKPNIDASRFLVGQVMPLVWKSHPEVRLMLAGATPKTSVRQLASDKVVVTGSVEDIRPCYAQSKILVAPMRIGSGLQNKILEAMSMGIPCVTTTLANASIGAVDGQHILLGATAQELADAIVRLLNDESLRKTLADNASQFVRQHFSWQSAGDKLETILLQAVEKRKTRNNNPRTEVL